MLALLYGMKLRRSPCADIAHAPSSRPCGRIPTMSESGRSRPCRSKRLGPGDALRFFRDLCCEVQPIIKAGRDREACDEGGGVMPAPARKSKPRPASPQTCAGAVGRGHLTYSSGHVRFPGDQPKPTTVTGAQLAEC